jgi:hypothetical protein
MYTHISQIVTLNPKTTSFWQIVFSLFHKRKRGLVVVSGLLLTGAIDGMQILFNFPRTELLALYGMSLSSSHQDSRLETGRHSAIRPQLGMGTLSNTNLCQFAHAYV